jgi:hypothetical protein
MKNKISTDENLAHHPAWEGSNLSEKKDRLLSGQKPFSYLLGTAEDDNQYSVSWVHKDGHIADSRFVYNAKTKTWFYSNGTPHECKNIDELLSSMFHCTKKDLHPSKK